MPLLLFILAVIVLVVLMRTLSRRQTIRALETARLSEEEQDMLLAQVPLMRKVPEELRPALEGKINRFLHQVDFIGCDGLEVTDEMRLSIAGQACLLVMNIDRWYNTLRTVLIYPGAFKSQQARQDGYVVTEREEVRLGESWSRGPIVLSWPHSDAGAQNDTDGHNVVLHEFAHQIDQLSGNADGAPLMNKGQSFDDWSRVFLDAFEAHQRSVARGRRTVLDAYGATAHEEFFAVAVEVFFEKPVQLRSEEPEVYGQLMKLFRLDPARW